MTARRAGLVRYLLWQIPSWVGIGVLLLWLHAELGLTTWLSVAIFAGFVAKDLLLFPAMRDTLAPERSTLVGARGRAVERLAPSGYVRVNGELWRAESGDEIPEGAPVIVRDIRGLTLLVDRA